MLFLEKKLLDADDHTLINGTHSAVCFSALEQGGFFAGVLMLPLETMETCKGRLKTHQNHKQEKTKQLQRAATVCS